MAAPQPDLNQSKNATTAILQNMNMMKGAMRQLQEIIQETNKQYTVLQDKLSDIVDKTDLERKQRDIILKRIEEENLLEKEKLTYVEKASIEQEVITNLYKERSQLIKDQLEKNIFLDNLFNEQIKKAEKEKELLIEERKNGIIDKKTARDAFTKLEEQLEITRDNAAANALNAAILSEQLENNESLLKTEIKRANVAQKQVGYVQNFAHHLGISANVNETWLGSLEQTLAASEGISSILSNIKPAILDIINPSNVFANSVELVAESTFVMAREMDNTLASFNKATGAGGQYNKVIDEVRFGSLAAGVGLKESAQATQALFENMTAFSQLNQGTQAELIRTTALFENLGISSQTTAKNLDLSTKALGMTTSEAVHAQKEIISVAKELGIAPGKLAEQFAASVPQLAQYGKQSINVFKSLAAQSKATGIEMSSLIGIAQQFDTFEGASQAAGKLNSILGGPLINSVDLLAAEEGERIIMLRESIKLSGKNWAEMGKFDKMALANAAGIKDMAEAAKLFGATDAEFNAVSNAQNANALSTERLAELSSQGVSAQEKLAKAMEGLTGAAAPLLNIVTSLVDKLLVFIDFLGPTMGPMLIGITFAIYALYKGYIFLQAATLALTGKTIILAEAKATEAGATNISIIAGLRYIAVKIWEGIVLAATIIKYIALGVAIAAAIVIYGLYQAIVAAVTLVTLGFNAALMANPIGLIVLGVIALIAAFVLLIKYFDPIDNWIKSMSNGFLNIWDVLLLLSGPIGWVILAAKKVYENWSLVSSAIISVLKAPMNFFRAVSKGISSLSNGFLDVYDTILILMGPIGWLILAGKKMWESWGSGLQKISNIFAELTTGISNTFSMFKNIFSFKANIPFIPHFAGGVDNFSGGMAMVGENGPEMVSLPQNSNVVSNGNTSKIQDAAMSLRKEQMISNSNTSTKHSETSSEKIREIKEQAQKDNRKDSNVPVILKIDGRELGKVIINLLDKEMKLNMVGV